MPEARLPSFIPLVRGSWGMTLLSVPGRLITLAGGQATPRARLVARVLGARHVAQAAVEARTGARWIRAGQLVDASHAASGFALAAADSRWRRVAVTDALIALCFVLAPSILPKRLRE